MEHLYDKLKKLQISGCYPYHMPGHKRRMDDFPMKEYYGIDITEIDGFDDLHNPGGILKDVMERASSIFGAESYLLVNGSTGGILSAVSAVARRGGTVIMARNCHKAVYHAVYLNRCSVRYIYPSFLETYGICGSISPKSVERQLQTSVGVCALVLTSPTYDGVVSDIETIVEMAHRRQIPVIVDEAHGAHFCVDARFPKDAVSCGADIVIHSIHKTLPALTQTGLLHVQGSLVDRERLQQFLKIYQTSSPSYILMAGIEQCISILETEREPLCHRFFEYNKLFTCKTENLGCLKILSSERTKEIGQEIFDYDPGKKVISVKGTTQSGRGLYNVLLNQYNLQMEMAGWDYVTAILTIMDGREGYMRLADALRETDGRLCKKSQTSHTEIEERPENVYNIYEAMEEKKEEMLLEDCEGKICGAFIQVYPPGIPLIVPGERFTKSVIRQLLYYRQQGFVIEGLRENRKKASIIRKETYA